MTTRKKRRGFPIIVGSPQFVRKTSANMTKMVTTIEQIAAALAKQYEGFTPGIYRMTATHVFANLSTAEQIALRDGTLTWEALRIPENAILLALHQFNGDNVGVSFTEA